jgi:hypothetical protein
LPNDGPDDVDFGGISVVSSYQNLRTRLVKKPGKIAKSVAASYRPGILGVVEVVGSNPAGPIDFPWEIAWDLRVQRAPST